MWSKPRLVGLLSLLLAGLSSLSQPAPQRQGLYAVVGLNARAADSGESITYLPYIGSSGYVSRVNVPHFATANIFPDRYNEMAIFWLGRVTPTENYADVRIGYSDDALELRVAIFDRLLWFDATPSPADLEAWDAVTLYLGLGADGGATPGAADYRLVSQLSWVNQDRENWQTAYRGNGTGWSPATVPISTTSRWRGNAPNSAGEARGWEAGFKIPFASLGLSGPPGEGTRWRFGVAVHDRDDSAGTPIPIQLWPETLDPSRPASWGELQFGLPHYTAPSTTTSQTVTIREGVAGAEVPDASVGGTAENLCPGGSFHIWNEWGNRNYGSSKAATVQNQADVADWPCFAKYFVTFPLDAIPRGRAIVSATLTLDHFANSGDTDPSAPNAASSSFVHVLTVPATWTESTLTWNNDPQPIENVSQAWVPVVTQCLPGGGAPCMPRSWDVSYAVARAYTDRGPISFALYSSDSAYHSGKFFTASDTGDWAIAARPTLTVVWGDP